MLKSNPLQQWIWTGSLLLAPLLILIGQFFLSVPGGANLTGWTGVLGFALWIPALHGVLTITGEKSPKLSTLTFLIAIIGCVAGTNFMFEILYLDSLAIQSPEEVLQIHENMGIGAVLTLYLPGLMFPLSFILTGIAAIRSKKLGTLTGVLFMLTGVSFPLGRIPRIPELMHITNGLMLLVAILVLWEAGKIWFARKEIALN